MNVTVLETNVLHASDVVYWLDGTTGTDASNRDRVPHPLLVEFDARPSDLQTLGKSGQMALWRRPEDSIVAGLADEAQRERPAAALYNITGTVRDPNGRYNPRRFDLNVGHGGGHIVVLYPSPVAVRFSKAGGLIGRLRFEASDTPVPWALLQLQVTVSMGNTIIFRSQTDGKGDFLLSMRRLPPLPESVTAYTAVLSVNANAAADAETPLNPDVDLAAMQLMALDSSSFSSAIALNVVPGEIRLLESFNRDYLAVQAA